MFTAQVFQNQFLPRGADEVHAIVSVTASPGDTGDAAAPGGPLVFGFLLDCSGSMNGEKLASAKHALREAIGLLREDCRFFVVTGRGHADLIVPPLLATVANKAIAEAALRKVTADGGTAISRWLELAADQFRAIAAEQPRGEIIAQALLLTDGQNDVQDPLASTLARCAGVFQCDARGVGTDWNVAQLRGVAQALLGTVDLIAAPEQIAADFNAILQTALAKAVPEVRLRLWTPQGARVLFCKQVAPEILDLSAKATPDLANPQVRDYPTGAWSGNESRDYHFAIQVRPGEVGQRMLAGRASLLTGGTAGTKVADAQVLAMWTDDEARSAVLDRTVAHYTGQGELAAVIQEGLQARQAGDEEQATRKLGRAVQLAAESGNEGTTKLLRKVVDVIDEEAGTVKLRRGVDDADAMALDTRSTKTRRIAG